MVLERLILLFALPTQVRISETDRRVLLAAEGPMVQGPHELTYICPVSASVCLEATFWVGFKKETRNTTQIGAVIPCSKQSLTF